MNATALLGGGSGRNPFSITVRPWRSRPTLQSIEALNRRRVFVRMRDGRQENEFAELQGRNPSSRKHHSLMDPQGQTPTRAGRHPATQCACPSPATCENRNEIAKSPPPHQKADLLVGPKRFELSTFRSGGERSIQLSYGPKQSV